MKNVLLFATALMITTSFAQSLTRVEKGNRRAELRKINELFRNIRSEGACVSLGRVQFNQEESIPGGCGGTFTKVAKGESKSIVLENTRCTNVVVGLETSYDWFGGRYLEIQENNSATRMYKLSNPQDGKVTIQINKDALGYDNDTLVVLSSNSGKNCYSMDIRF